MQQHCTTKLDFNVLLNFFNYNLLISLQHGAVVKRNKKMGNADLLQELDEGKIQSVLDVLEGDGDWPFSFLVINITVFKQIQLIFSFPYLNLKFQD
jgi:hypothetical protein